MAQHVLKGSLNTKPEQLAKQPAVPSTFSHPGLGPANDEGAKVKASGADKDTQIISGKKSDQGFADGGSNQALSNA